jgi:thioredoxin-related protein
MKDQTPPFMKLHWIWLFPLLLLGLALSAGKPASEPHGEKMRWYTMEEVIKIKNENPGDDKAVFIDVYTDWCGWCKRMDANTFSDEQVQAILTQEFYPVKFDAEQKEAIRMGGKMYKYVPSGRRGYHELAATLLQGKMSYPTMVFLDQDLSMIQPLPGYRGAKEILPILHFIGKEKYKQQSWEAFSVAWQKQG